MLAQARRRCRAAVAAGRVDLRVGTASALPWEDARFDAVCSVNNVQFWDPPSAGLAEVRRVLHPGGQLTVAVHEWAARDPIDGISEGSPLGEVLPALLAAAGFSDVRASRRLNVSGFALYFLAARP